MVNNIRFCLEMVAIRKKSCQQFSTVFNCSVGFCVYSRSALGGSKNLVNSLRLVCRVLLVFALSLKRVEDPCQASSMLLSEIAIIRNILTKGVEDPCQVFSMLLLGSFM